MCGLIHILCLTDREITANLDRAGATLQYNSDDDVADIYKAAPTQGTPVMKHLYGRNLTFTALPVPVDYDSVNYHLYDIVGDITFAANRITVRAATMIHPGAVTSMETRSFFAVI